MKCAYCQLDFHPQTLDTQIGFANSVRLPRPDAKSDGQVYAKFETIVCSACKGGHVYFKMYRIAEGFFFEDLEHRLVYPRGNAAFRPQKEVPTNISIDFLEAGEVLAISPKASAALARRCLQAVLAAHGYNNKDLVKQVEAVLHESDSSKVLPLAIRDNLDAIRNFGNFSAHPITDKTTLQIVDVEEGEAEWCLEILLDLFEHYYVNPARAAEKRAALSSKLSAAGKPPMKTA